MIENLLPGIELVNGDCAAVLPVLPVLPPADLILTSPPDDSLRDYGGYNGAFDFDAVAAACVANLAPGGVWSGGLATDLVDGGESGTSFRQALGVYGIGVDAPSDGFFRGNPLLPHRPKPGVTGGAIYVCIRQR